jgi:WD40 repeat protein
MILHVRSGASHDVPIDSDRCSALSIHRAAWSADGKLLAFGGPVVRRASDSQPRLSGIRIFDIEAGSEQPPLPLPIDSSHNGQLAGLEFSPDGRTLAALSAIASSGRPSLVRLDQPVVTLWDVTNTEKKSTIPVPSELCGKGQGVVCVRLAGFSPDGKALALIASERPDGPGKSEAIILRLDGRPPERLAFSRATRRIALAAGGDRAAMIMLSREHGAPSLLWDGKTGGLVAPLGNYQTTIDAATRSPDGRILVQTLERPLPEGTLARVWDLDTGEILASGIDPRSGGHRVTDVSPKADLMAQLDNSGSIVIRDTRTRGVLGAIDTKMRIADRPDPNAMQPLPLVVFMNDGRTLAAVGKNETTLWDVKTGARLHPLAGSPPPFVAPASGAYVAMAACRTTTVHDTKSGRRTATVSHGDNCATGAAVSADGTLLLTLVSGSFFSGPTEARLWKLPGPASTVLTGYDDAGAIGAFAGDGRTIATAGPDGTVNLWDPVTSRRLLTLPGFKQRVTSLRFLDDGRALIVGYEKEVRVWHALAQARRQP